MDYFFGVFTLLCILFFGFVFPFLLSYEICRKRNRNVTKGLLITLFTGWFGTIGLYLALRKRVQPGVFD